MGEGDGQEDGDGVGEEEEEEDLGAVGVVPLLGRGVVRRRRCMGGAAAACAGWEGVHLRLVLGAWFSWIAFHDPHLRPVHARLCLLVAIFSYIYMTANFFPFPSKNILSVFLCIFFPEAARDWRDAC